MFIPMLQAWLTQLVNLLSFGTLNLSSMGFISSYEYKRALSIVKQYAAQQANFEKLMADAVKMFPIGTEVGSSKSLASGVVYGYGSWRDIPLLKIRFSKHDGSVGLNTILVPNAYVIRSAE
nr:MAG TPA: hypothetical protein [Caudoviricetes sp.]